MRLSIVILLTAFTCCAALGQSPAQQPQFEVASVKPAIPRDAAPGRARSTGAAPASSRGDAGLVVYRGVTLKALLIRAYGVRPYQIVGPSWMDSEKYDVIAKVPEGAPREQIPSMLQALLLERFRMSVHWATKDAPVYALVVDKAGPKLTRSQQDTKRSMGFTSYGHLDFKASTLADFAGALSSFLDRPVVDMTNIDGVFDIALDASPDSLTGPFFRAREEAESPAAPSAAPSIFTAIRGLGLRLDARKAPLKQLMVDAAERVPIPN